MKHRERTTEMGTVSAYLSGVSSAKWFCSLKGSVRVFSLPPVDDLHASLRSPAKRTARQHPESADHRPQTLTA